MRINRKPYFCNMKIESATSIDVTLVRKLLQPRCVDGHKGTFGHVCLIAGSHGMMGAALLSAEAALRSGVGRLTAHIPEQDAFTFQVKLPEALLHFDENSPTRFATPCFSNIFDSFVIGPGIGTEYETSLALKTQMKLLLEAECPPKNTRLVLDADALNLLAADYQLFSLLPKDTILTPHIGEMQRICAALEMPSESEEQLQASALKIAYELHLNIVLKNSQTHIFTSNGQIYKNGLPKNSGMATAGSGDVLSGIIGGLLAQGYAPHEACVLGVFLHSMAGRHAAQHLGEHSMLASDIIVHLPDSFQTIY